MCGSAAQSCEQGSGMMQSCEQESGMMHVLLFPGARVTPEKTPCGASGSGPVGMSLE